MPARLLGQKTPPLSFKSLASNSITGDVFTFSVIVNVSMFVMKAHYIVNNQGRLSKTLSVNAGHLQACRARQFGAAMVRLPIKAKQSLASLKHAHLCSRNLTAAAGPKMRGKTLRKAQRTVRLKAGQVERKARTWHADLIAPRLLPTH